MRLVRYFVLSLFLVPFHSFATPADPNWVSLGGMPGVDGTVRAIAWSGTNVYLGGKFAIAGSVQAANIARWDGTKWQALGSGVDDEVDAIAVDGSGHVYAGGKFQNAGGSTASYIAMWDGSNWNALGAGVDAAVAKIAVTGSMVYVAGGFSNAGGSAAAHVAQWNGSSWSTLGSGVDGVANALAVDGSGNVFVGGLFANAGGSAANNIAKWNGSSWSALSSGTNNAVNALLIDGSGTLYAGGAFSSAGGNAAIDVASWNGSSWSAMGGGIADVVTDLVIDSNNHLYAASMYTSNEPLMMWSGSNWGTPSHQHIFNNLYALAADASGNIYIGGELGLAGGGPAPYTAVNHIVQWDGSHFHALGSGINNKVSSLVTDNKGNLYVGGYFETVPGNNPCWFIAKWDGVSWSNLGVGLNDAIQALAIDHKGNLYATGYFTSLSDLSLQVNYIAKWDGTNWTALGSGLDYLGENLVIDDSDNVYVGGAFTHASGVSANNIAMWNGTSWSALGSGLNGGNVYGMTVDNNNHIYVVGNFTFAGGVSANALAMWNGSTWDNLGNPVVSGYCVSVLYDKSRQALYASCGTFALTAGGTTNGFAKWDGASWTAFPVTTTGGIEQMTMDADDNLYVSDTIYPTLNTAVSSIRKWDGSAWTTLGGALNGDVRALAIYNNALEVGGTFTTVDGGNITSPYLTRYLSTHAKIPGSHALDMIGTAVAMADMDNDGYADVIIGSPHVDVTIPVSGKTVTLKDAGEVRIISGATGAVLQRFVGTSAKQQFGTAIAVIPDFNADGIPELAIGSPLANVTTTVGSKQVVLKAAGNVSIYDGATGAFIQSIADGEHAGDHFGASLYAGDLDNNSTSDVVIGAPGYDVSTTVGIKTVVLKDAGRVYVYDGLGNYVRDGDTAGEHFGSAVMIDAHYFVLLVGSPNYANPVAVGTKIIKQKDAGRVEIFDGTSGVSGSKYGELTGQGAGDRYGAAIALLNQDVDSDGNFDWVVGSPGADILNSTTGKMMKDAGLISFYSGYSGTVLQQLTGGAAGDNFGAALYAGGDFNHDGNNDLAISSPKYDVSSNASGKTVLLKDAGKVDVWSSTELF